MCHLKNSRPKIMVLVTKVLFFENLKHFIFHLEGRVLVEKNKTNHQSSSMDLTEAEDTKMRWQEHIELYKKDLNDPDNHDGVIIHLESGILECEVKWALGSITTNKASGGDGITIELFQVLKDGAVKMLHSLCQQIWKTQQWTGLERVSFHSSPKERQC